ILILHGDSHPEGVSHSSQWFVHTGERDACNRCQRYSNKGSMPTTRIQPLVRRPLETLSTRKESPAADWIHVAASLLLPGTFTRDVSFRRKKLFCISRNWSEAVLHRSLARDGQDSLETGLTQSR